MSRAEPVGTFCLVLHSHLPWLAHHGRWPVGEEWLYQAWTQSYLPVIGVLRRLAAQGRRRLLTLGVTPVLAAQLDDPYCLRGVHAWLGDWLLRAHDAAGRAEPAIRELAAAEHRRASAALVDFESSWQHGGTAVLRPLVDADAIELLGGPATHPFQPLLSERVRRFALHEGLTDAAVRFGTRPAGIWAPECGYSPGMEHGYAAAGVHRFVVDGPALHGDTAFARTVGGSDVVCFGRDLEITYRVWSPRSGYPGRRDYRDFHTFDHPSGLKPARVTGRSVPPERKKPYDPHRAAAAVTADATDFVAAVRRRLVGLAERHGRAAVVVAGYDTELFGHWWAEGPVWLEAVLRSLPAAGVRVSTLSGALDAGCLAGPVDLAASSWGTGKDWRVWADGPVAGMVAANAELQEHLLRAVDKAPPQLGRNPITDAMATQALHALTSDWAFMVSKNSAPDYARGRAGLHTGRVRELSGLLDAGRLGAAARLAAGWRDDDAFGHLDARHLRR